MDINIFVTKDMVIESDIYVIDPNGYKMLVDAVKRNNMKIKLVPIYIDVDVADQERRYRARGNTRNEFWERYKSEAEQFDKFEEEMITYNRKHTYVYRIKNVAFHYSVKMIEEYIYNHMSLIEKLKYNLRRLIK